MKRMLWILLALLFLIPMQAGAEGTPSSVMPEGIAYYGTWKEVEDLGFQLYLPNEWVIFIDEQDFTAGNEQATRFFWVEAHDSSGYSLEDVLIEFSQLYDESRMMVCEGASFVTFKAGDADIYCGVTLSPDQSLLYFFKFISAKDAEFIGLADQILSTYSAL